MNCAFWCLTYSPAVYKSISWLEASFSFAFVKIVWNISHIHLSLLEIQGLFVISQKPYNKLNQFYCLGSHITGCYAINRTPSGWISSPSNFPVDPRRWWSAPVAARALAASNLCRCWISVFPRQRLDGHGFCCAVLWWKDNQKLWSSKLFADSDSTFDGFCEAGVGWHFPSSVLMPLEQIAYLGLSENRVYSQL